MNKLGLNYSITLDIFKVLEKIISFSSQKYVLSVFVLISPVQGAQIRIIRLNVRQFCNTLVLPKRKENSQESGKSIFSRVF